MHSEILNRFKNKEITDTTRNLHLSVLNKIKGYKKELSFSEITPTLINKYAAYTRLKLNNKTNKTSSMQRVIFNQNHILNLLFDKIRGDIKKFIYFNVLNI